MALFKVADCSGSTRLKNKFGDFILHVFKSNKSGEACKVSIHILVFV
jgi:hypothetical protein